MRVLLRATGPDGKAFPGKGEAFAGKTALDVVLAMKDVSPFTAGRSVDEHIATVLHCAGDLLGVELRVQGRTIDERAASFVSTLIEHGLAELRPDSETDATKPPKGEKKPCAD